MTDDDDNSGSDPKTSGWTRHLVAAVGVAGLGMAAVGAAGGYPSPSVPDINTHHNPFHLSSTQQAWFVSFQIIGGLVGPLPAGMLCDRYGRKVALLSATVSFVVAWTLVIAASSVTMFNVGVFLLGASETLYLSVASVYLTEVAPLTMRGLLLSLHDVFLDVGFLLVYTVGAVLHWNWLAVACAVLPTAVAFAIPAVAESPRWLVQRGGLDRAADELQRLRGAGRPVDDEIRELRTALQDSTIGSRGTDLLRPPLLKYVVVSQVLFVLREFSNIPVLRAYAVTVFESTDIVLDPYAAGAIFGVMQLVGSLCCIVVIGRVRHTVLLAASFGAMAASMASLAAYFMLREMQSSFVDRYLTWLPVAGAFGAIFSYTMGCGPLPHLLTNEMFPTATRGRAHALAIFTAYAAALAGVQCFEAVRTRIGDYGAFWIGAVSCSIGVVFVWFLVPETKNKSLEQIQKELQGDVVHDLEMKSSQPKKEEA